MNSDKNISLRERIRYNLVAAMESAGINQVQLADKLNISKGTVNNWTRGNNSPDVDIVPRICEVLGIPILELYSPTPFESSTPLLAPAPNKTAPPELTGEAIEVGKAYDAAEPNVQFGVCKLLDIKHEPKKEYYFATAADKKGLRETTLTHEQVEATRKAITKARKEKR